MNSRHAARTPLDIHIVIDTLDPLSGTARPERGDELPFEGWLGLLDALSKMVGSADDSDQKSSKEIPMPFNPASIQKFSTQDPPIWLQVGDHEAYLGYVADEEEGSIMGLAFIRFRKGVHFDFRWAYHEVCVVTRGSLTVRFGDEVITAEQGQFLHMPAGVAGTFDVREDFEAVCVHFPTDGRAGREWTGAELLPSNASIRPVEIDDVWP